MIVMLGLAFGVGGALFALRFGDRRAKLIGVCAIAVIACLLVPEIGGRFAGQVAIAVISAGFGLAAFRLAVRSRRGA